MSKDVFIVCNCSLPSMHFNVLSALHTAQFSCHLIRFHICTCRVVSLPICSCISKNVRQLFASYLVCVLVADRIIYVWIVAHFSWQRKRAANKQKMQYTHEVVVHCVLIVVVNRFIEHWKNDFIVYFPLGQTLRFLVTFSSSVICWPWVKSIHTKNKCFEQGVVQY